jgi:hypothetical protein
VEREREQELIAILNEESRYYRQDAAAWRAAVAQADADHEQTLAPPTEEQLTQFVLDGPAMARPVRASSIPQSAVTPNRPFCSTASPVTGR